MQVGDELFIGYPSAVHYGVKGTADSYKGKKAFNQLLWGDWARVDKIEGNWVNVRARRRSGWVRKENLQTNRLLEVNFVDIGQGDGCHIQTPEDKSIIIDAGEEDNMYRFLRWRFGRFENKYTFESFIISHPDKDHYYGFGHLFDEKNVYVDNVFHNSIVEQKIRGKNSLGAERKVGRKKYIAGLVHDLNELKKITNSKARRGGRQYPNMLKTAVHSGRISDISSLLASTDWQAPKYVPGYGPQDNKSMTMKLLGPVPDELTPGKFSLRRFGNDGKTKNGHSIIILLEIGNVKILLGGDLNEKSQKYLLEHYTGLNPNPKTAEDIGTLITEGRKHFEVDLAKACHHGAADILPNFLKATNPLATVISSGDDEPHSHPRADALGMTGKFSRSERPMIFCTELARSGNEHIKHPNLVRRELREKLDKEYAVKDSDNSTQAEKDKAEQNINKHLQIIERSVANYGMINVRTDGSKMIVAQRLERKRKKSERWDIYKFESDERGRLFNINK